MSSKPKEFRHITPPYGVNDKGANRKRIFDAVEASLKRLQTDYINLYQIHVPDEVIPLRETMRAFNDLVRILLAGKFKKQMILRKTKI